MVLAEFRDLDDSAPMTADQIQKFIAHIEQLKPGVRAWLDGRIKDDGIVTAARHRLADRGFPASGCCGSRPTRCSCSTKNVNWRLGWTIP